MNDLLDKSKPLRMARREELTDELLQEAMERNAKLWLGNFENEKIAKLLNLDTNNPIKITMRGNIIKHTLNRHSENSNLARFGGQPPINYKDIIAHTDIVNNADIYATKLDEKGRKSLVSAKQIDGYYVVVETISTKYNTLSLKTIYRENGTLNVNSPAFKDAEGFLSLNTQAVSSFSPKPSADLDNQPSANKIIPQNKHKSQNKSFSDGGFEK